MRGSLIESGGFAPGFVRQCVAAQAAAGLGPSLPKDRPPSAPPVRRRVAWRASAAAAIGRICQEIPRFDRSSAELLNFRVSSEGFPSGQREQTVNLPALPSKVRILPPPPLQRLSVRTTANGRDAGAEWGGGRLYSGSRQRQA